MYRYHYDSSKPHENYGSDSGKIKIQKVHASFLYSVYFCIHDFWKGAIKLMCLSRRYID